MKHPVDRTICPALSACVESWPFFPARDADSRPSIYLIGNRTIDRYIAVPAGKLDVVQRILLFFDGQHSIEWIENWLLENEGKKVDVVQLYERMAAAELLVSNESGILPPGYDITEWSIRLFNVPVDWLFRRTAAWNSGWLPGFLAFSALLFVAGAVCLAKLHFLTAVFQYTLHGSGVFLYVGLLAASFAVHEMAHGVAASWFGMTARRFSAALYLGFIPSLHLRIGGLYTLSRRRRIVVWMAGVWCNFLLASAGAVVLTLFAAHMGPTARYFVSQATVANVTMGIFNLFPFMPTDGYFILSTLLRTYNVRKQACFQFLDLARLPWSRVSWFAVAYLLLSSLTILLLLQRLLAILIKTPLKSPAGVFNVGLVLLPLFLFLWKTVRRAVRSAGQKGNAMGSFIAWVRTRWISVSAISLLSLAGTALYFPLHSCAARLGVCQSPECNLLRASSCAQAFGQNLLVYLLLCFAGLGLLLLSRLTLGRRFAVAVNPALMVFSLAGLITAARMAFIEIGWLGLRCPTCVVATCVLTTVFVLGAAGSFWRSSRGVTALLLTAWMALGIPSFLFLLREGAVPSVKRASTSLSGPAPALPAAGHYTLGAATPELEIVEFADLQCPACRDQQENMDAFLGRYGDKVRFVFYHYPVSKRHPLARRAAEAAECAGAQGKFWEAVHLFYRDQDKLSSRAMLTFADKLGLDKTAYQNCLSSGQTAGRIARDAALGDAIGITGVPTIVVGDLKITGEIAPSKFSQIVELGMQGQKPDAVAAAGAGCSTGEPGIASLSASEANSLLAQSPGRIRFIDVRSAAGFDWERIPGAVSLSRGISSRQWQQLKTAELLVLYDAGAETAQSACAIIDSKESLSGARDALAHHGIGGDHVRFLAGGLTGWEAHGSPVERPLASARSTTTQSGAN